MSHAGPFMELNWNGISSIPENATKFRFSLHLNYLELFATDRFQLMTNKTIFGIFEIFWNYHKILIR